MSEWLGSLIDDDGFDEIMVASRCTTSANPGLRFLVVVLLRLAVFFLSTPPSFSFACAPFLSVFLAFRLRRMSRLAMLVSRVRLRHGSLVAFHTRFLFPEPLSPTVFDLGRLLSLSLVLLAPLEAFVMVVLLSSPEALWRCLLLLAALVCLLVGLLVTLLGHWLLLLPPLLVAPAAHLLGLLGASLLRLLGAHVLGLVGLPLVTTLESLLLRLLPMGLAVALLG